MAYLLTHKGERDAPLSLTPLTTTRYACVNKKGYAYTYEKKSSF